MTQEKQLLLRDLSARLPYQLRGRGSDGVTWQAVVIYDTGTIIAQQVNGICCCACGFVPYLRPMSSMTDEEKNYIERYFTYTGYNDWDYVDYLNSHHFDYRGLIEKGLALEAPKEMYK